MRTTRQLSALLVLGGEEGEFPPMLPRHFVENFGAVYNVPAVRVFFDAPIEIIAVRFSEDEVIMQILVHLKEEPGTGGCTAGPSAAGGVGDVYADDAGVVAKSADGPGEDDDRIVLVVFLGVRTDAREGETATITATAAASHRRGRSEVRAETTECRYLGGLVNEHGDLIREINYRSKIAWERFKMFGREHRCSGSRPVYSSQRPWKRYCTVA